MRNNPSFNNAEKLTIEGKFSEALDEYNKLLVTDLSKEDSITKSQINIRVATLFDLMGEKAQSVEALNQIANNEKEYFVTRSFAYEYMARMVYETRSQEVLKIVSSVTGIKPSGVDPYTNVSLVLLKKSEDIAPLYLGLTQKMKIEVQAFEGRYTVENISKYRYNLGIIDSMINDIEAEQNKGYMLPLALLRKAQIAERIESSGNYGLPKTVEDYYKDAIEAYEKYPEARSYNYVYYEYSRYLANKYQKDMETFGESRKGDVQVILTHYQKNVPERQNLKIFLSNLNIANKSNRQKTEFEVVKKIVPEFSL